MAITCSNNEQTALSNHIKQLTNNAAGWPIMKQHNLYNEESEDGASSLDDNDSSEHAYLNSPQDNDDDQTYSDMEEAVICGCGKAMSAGWDCSQCRSSCSTCHRALGPNETCNRCVSVKRNTIIAN
ncbi:hypothetical protein MAM1_0418d10418 [Mucor ambiguus]|uniref:Uncharacterized protein n=1 Tax=Mucor ambiguus TaxID=91626 RepID=A0A0C9N8B1_9FUNG|nr:hypothetical protein MAM1_0418d10418 [Mucor ambiguus]